MRHRGVAAIVGTVLTLTLVFPLTNLNIGEPQTSALATSGSAHSALAGLSSAGEPSSAQGSATVRAIREAANSDAVLGLGGAGPSQQDFSHSTYGNFPLMLVLIALATFVLLTRAFRSVVLAAKAVLFNILSVCAAYGTMVLIWQSGYGSKAVWSIPATGGAHPGHRQRRPVRAS